MPWQPGQSGNPAGYHGTRHRRHKEIFDEIKKLGHRDALLTLSTIQNDEKNDPGLRVAAATALAPFAHPKLQALPTPRFVETPIQVPEFTDVSVAESFVAKIATLVAGGELDIQTGLELSTLTKNWIESKNAARELELKVISVEGGPPEQTIRIEGGLPQLPGTNITMPVLDGRPVTNGALEPPSPAVPQPNECTNGHGPESQGGEPAT